MDVLSLLKEARSKGASDVHLVAFSPPLLRVDGLLKPLAGAEPVTGADIEDMLKQLTTDKERAEFSRELELDFGYTAEGVGRLRCNVAMQRGTVSMVMRLLPPVVATIEDLKLPAVCKDLIMRRRGMVVVSGPTGSGKSTTLAAMIQYLNNLESRRVVTVEDPIEYVYASNKCTVTQRELGSDTLSFAEALRHVLRQDPNVILIGEMRDLETASAALTIAETGHLVLTTGHASSSAQAIERIIDMFPAHERHLAQARLSTLLLGILCQTLVPKSNGSGRVVAVEIMLANAAVRNLVREGKIYQVPNVISTSIQEGMQLMDQSLVRLFREGAIRRESLFSFCHDRDQVERLIGHMEMSGGAVRASAA